MNFYANALGELFEQYGSLVVQAPLWAFFVILGLELAGIWFSLRNKKAICPVLYLALVLAFPVFGTVAVIAANIIILSKIYHGNRKLRLKINFKRRIIPIIAALFIGKIVYIIFDAMGKYIVDYHTDEMLFMINIAVITSFIIFLREYYITSSTHYYLQLEEPKCTETVTEEDDINISGLPDRILYSYYEDVNAKYAADIVDAFREDRCQTDHKEEFNYSCIIYGRERRFKFYSEKEYRSFKDVISSEYIGRGIEKITVFNIEQNEKGEQESAERITLYRFTRGDLKALLTGAALMALSIFYCTPAWAMIHSKVIGFIGGIFAKF